MPRARLFLPWSLRDLRRRWALVAAIALVIALGTGTYAALLSTTAWRTESNDASFALLHTHDVRAALARGSTVEQGRLAAIVRGLPHAADVTAVHERLVLPEQVAIGRDLLVPGELVGTDASPGGEVDGVSVAGGRGLTPADDAQPAVVLERAFATANGLPTTGTLTLSGGHDVSYVGVGQSPEYFIVSGGSGVAPFLAQRSYAVVFAMLRTAQELTGAAGRVNDIVLTLRPGGASADAVRAELERALGDATPPVSVTVTTRAEMDAYRVLYEDIRGDEDLWRVVALLVLAGAAFAAFNLTTRIVEAQRREIGVGMALGVRPAVLAVRPLLFGATVAVIGVVLGIAVGLALGIPLRSVFTDMLPLPVWRTPFQTGTFAQAAVLGFVLPFAGVAWPVWRALRVEPIEAIRVGHLAARGGGLAHLLRRLPLPGRSYAQVPARNVLRAPRRSALTVLGIAAAITTLVTINGFLDTFRATLDTAQAELLRAAPDRLSVSLDTLQPADSPVVREVAALPQFSRVETGLLLSGVLRRGGTSFEVALEVLPPSSMWTPSLVAGRLEGGVVLAQKAADDVGVQVGDTVMLEHPQAVTGGLRTVSTPVVVSGIHPNPMRVFAYVDPSIAAASGLSAVTNQLTVEPAAGVSATDAQRALLGITGVASAQPTRVMIDGLRSSLDEFVGILDVAAAVTLLLALLIAFNTASIAVDERAREHATMMAFGLPLRTVLGMTIAETAIVGAAATVAGLAGGMGLLRWLTATTIPSVLPEIGVAATLATGTVLLVLALGIGAVTLAPLFTVRRLRAMDLPATLRVVE